MTIGEINALSDDGFVDKFGFLFEDTPQIAAQAATMRPFASIEALREAMLAVVAASGEEAHVALLRAHPELAGKAAIDHTLTEASTAEQASAGLDRLTPAEFADIHALNDAYRERFGFPFIICVRLTDKAGIFAALRQRVANPRPAEIATALAEVGKIASLRLRDAVA